MTAQTLGLSVALVLGCASLGIAETKSIDRTLPLSATGTVTLDAHNGSIQVRTWDRPEVEIHVRIDWIGVSASSYRFRATTVDIDGSPDRVSIRWNPPDRYGWSLWSLFEDGWVGPDVHYNVTAPRNARVEIRSHNAETDIRDANGAVRIGTHNGSVRAANLAGPLDLGMHNGWARVDFASFSHDSRIVTHNGAVELSLPAASKFNFNSQGHHVRVDSDFPLASQASYFDQRRSSSGSINGGGPGLQFITHNGSVRLRSK
jgi:hypothetical protein